MDLEKNKKFLIIVVSCLLLILLGGQKINATKTTVSSYYISISGKEFLKSFKIDYPKTYKTVNKNDVHNLKKLKEAVKISEVNSKYRIVLNSQISTLIHKTNSISISGTISDCLMNADNLSKKWSAPVNFGTAFSVLRANDLEYPNRNVNLSYAPIKGHDSSYVVTGYK